MEFTTFSALPPTDTECVSILREHLSQRLRLKSYVIAASESGAVPMGIDVEPLFPPTFGSSAIRSMGAAFSRIKPSTGYSFRRNLEVLGSDQEVSLKSYFSFRFRIYDAVLLELMRTRGGLVASNLGRLFAKNSPSEVFAFLDEDSSPLQELKIFRSLEWLPFGFTLIGLYPFLFSVAATLLLQWMNPWLGWSVPVLGLISVGMGHGSLDPLLSTSGGRPGGGFYFRYLGSMVLFFILWSVSPVVALGVFLAQSADHLGESYWLRVLNRSGNDQRVRALSWLWGLFASVFGVMFHWDQAHPVLSVLLGDPRWLSGMHQPSTRLAAGMLFLVAIGAASILDRYDHRSSGRHPSGVPATLLLGGSLTLLPLVQGFLCFFAFWHAWDTMRETRLRKGWSAQEYAKRALPFTSVAVAALVVGAYVTGFSERSLALLFILLGGLTVAHAPHMKRFLMSPPLDDGKIST